MALYIYITQPQYFCGKFGPGSFSRRTGVSFTYFEITVFYLYISILSLILPTLGRTTPGTRMKEQTNMASENT